MTPREIADHIEIGQVVQRYGRALDTADYELLRTVFAPDATLRYEMEGRGTEGNLEKWMELWRTFMVPFFWTSHQFSPPLIELDGDRARASCRLIASHVQIRHDDSRNLWTVYGDYEDQLARLEEGWRIQQRLFHGVHTEGELLPADAVKSLRERPPAPA